jgi:hypothetical protein
MRWITLGLAVSLFGALAGCTPEETPSTSSTVPPPPPPEASQPASTGDSASSSSSEHASGSEGSGGSANGAVALTGEKSDAERKYEAAEAKLAKKPEDTKLKTAVAAAAYAAGHYIEYDKPGLSPREKYRPALKLYRRALEFEPTHAKAKFEKEQIEKIYEGMGMPIPQ